MDVVNLLEIEPKCDHFNYQYDAGMIRRYHWLDLR